MKLQIRGQSITISLNLCAPLSVSLVKMAWRARQSRGSYVGRVDKSADAGDWHSTHQDGLQESFCLCFCGIYLG